MPDPIQRTARPIPALSPPRHRRLRTACRPAPNARRHADRGDDRRRADRARLHARAAEPGRTVRSPAPARCRRRGRERPAMDAQPGARAQRGAALQHPSGRRRQLHDRPHRSARPLPLHRRWSGQLQRCGPAAQDQPLAASDERVTVQANVGSMLFDPLLGTASPAGSVRIVDAAGRRHHPRRQHPRSGALVFAVGTVAGLAPC